MSALRRGLVAMSIGLGVIVAWAQPASAHAVLLRSEPSPQSTSADAPAAVRLEFSEPVETAFGAVRVYDVDGTRVDRGEVRRAQGGIVVEAPVRSLRDGTYTVTWRVVSGDAHRIRGGFVFYVVAPSTISPIAIGEEGSTSRAVGWGFGVVRFAWFSSLILLIGFVIARRFVWTPAMQTAGLSDSPGAAGVRARFGRALLGAWAVLLASGVASIVFQAASISGLSLRDAAAPSIVEQVLDTTYGRAWVVQLALAVLALVPLLALTQRRTVIPGRPPAWLTVFGAMLVGLAGTAAVSGHARTDSNPLLAEASLIVHLVAVGCWVGGLTTLVLLAGRGWKAIPDEKRPGLLRELIVRFTKLALIAVAVVAVTGTINTVMGFAGVSDLWETTYGRVVAAKIILLLLAVALASRHRRDTPRRLVGEEPERAVRSFGRTSVLEVGMLIGAVALAASLVALVPGRSLALAEKGPITQEQRAGPYRAQLLIDPSSVGENEVHVTYVTEAGLAAAEVTNATVRLSSGTGPARTVDMRLIAPGHFAGNVTFPVPGKYRFTAETPVEGAPATAQFRFSIARRD